MKPTLRLAAASVILAILGTACQQPHQYTGTVLQPPKPLEDVSVPAMDGTVFTLSDHQDQFVVLYFGYTNCPDICPATLTQLQQAIQKLGSDASKVRVAFVTVDPERDSLDALQAYLSHFDVSFVGLRPADDAQLAALGKEFGIFYESQPHDTMDTPYEVNHTSSVQVIHEMSLVEVFSSDTSAADLAADLKALMSQ
jgi:protein SCO1/2